MTPVASDDAAARRRAACCPRSPAALVVAARAAGLPVADWPLAGWALGAVLWVASQAFGLLLRAAPQRDG